MFSLDRMCSTTHPRPMQSPGGRRAWRGIIRVYALRSQLFFAWKSFFTRILLQIFKKVSCLAFAIVSHCGVDVSFRELVPRVYSEVGASEWEESGIELFHEPLRFQAIRKLFRKEGDVVQYSVHSFVTPRSSFSKTQFPISCLLSTP
jgi:hypothetical protein